MPRRLGPEAGLYCITQHCNGDNTLIQMLFNALSLASVNTWFVIYFQWLIIKRANHFLLRILYTRGGRSEARSEGSEPYEELFSYNGNLHWCCLSPCPRSSFIYYIYFFFYIFLWFYNTTCWKRANTHTHTKRPFLTWNYVSFPLQVVKLFAEAVKYSSKLDTTSLFHYRKREAEHQG